jgi:hypothetical protein
VPLAAPTWNGWARRSVPELRQKVTIRVRRNHENMRERTGFQILVAMLQIGVLNNELTRRNMELFASEVMPRLRN